VALDIIEMEPVLLYAPRKYLEILWKLHGSLLALREKLASVTGVDLLW
jgi:hypothetical protein